MNCKSKGYGNVSKIMIRKAGSYDTYKQLTVNL
jgi:hypothetical protein